jgi:hypothetical protein
MIIWSNGAFGIGESLVATELRAVRAVRIRRTELAMKTRDYRPRQPSWTCPTGTSSNLPMNAVTRAGGQLHLALRAHRRRPPDAHHGRDSLRGVDLLGPAAPATCSTRR